MTDHVAGTRHGRVYLSYVETSLPDSTCARELIASLGPLCSVYSDRAPVDSRWAELIEAELEKADLCVVVLSAASAVDSVIRAEYETAIDLAAEHGGRPALISVLIHPLPEMLPPSLAPCIDTTRSRSWAHSADTPFVVSWIVGWLRRAESQTAPSIVGDSALIPPEGAVETESSLYIEREADSRAAARISQRGAAAITIKGPKNVGKTALVLRLLQHATAIGKRAVMLDFQLLDSETRSSRSLFYPRFFAAVAEKAGVEVPCIEPGLDPVSWCTKQMRTLLKRLPEYGLVLALDEIEAILDSTYWEEFVGMLRSWYSRSADDDCFKKLAIVLVLSTEDYASFDTFSSPLNVGDVFELPDLTRAEVNRLNNSHGRVFPDHLMDPLWRLVRGHPYLVRRAMYLVSIGKYQPSDITDPVIAAAEGGPFGEHLRHLIDALCEYPSTCDGLAALLNGERLELRRFDRDRLRRLGVVHQLPDSTLRVRCGLYETYLRNRLPVSSRIQSAASEG